MRTMFYQTVGHKIEVIFTNDGYLTIRQDGKQIADFCLEDVWDTMVKSLKEMEVAHSAGLHRRIYEAKNLYRLTNEYLAKHREDIKREEK